MEEQVTHIASASKTCSQLEQKLGCSIRHVQTSNSAGPELLDEEEEEVIRRLDSEALREGLKEVRAMTIEALVHGRCYSL